MKLSDKACKAAKVQADLALPPDNRAHVPKIADDKID